MSSQARTFGLQFAVAAAHPALPGHFPGHPIVPGVLLLDHVLTGVAAELKRPVSVLKQVKFAAALSSGETASVACEASGDNLKFSVQAWRADVLVTLASGYATLAPRPAMPHSSGSETGGAKA